MTFKVGHWSLRFKVDIERKKKVTQIVGNNEQFDLKKKKKPSHFWRYINCQYDKVYVSHIR